MTNYETMGTSTTTVTVRWGSELEPIGPWGSI
jgi:hypothetical protein